MSTTNECLEFIIGLSTTDCACFDADKPVNFDRSDSGLHLGDIDDLPLDYAKAAEDCDSGNLWEMLDDARKKGITEMKAALMQSITSKVKLTRQPWSGIVADVLKFGKDVTLDTNYASFSFICADSVSGFIRLRRIGLLFKTSQTFNIELWSNYQDTAIATYSVTSDTNRLAWYTLPTPIELPMSRPEVDFVQYWLVYATASAPVPKDIKINCGCGYDIPEWSPRRPVFYNCYTEGKKIKERWPEFIMARGQAGDDITERTSNWNSSTETNGLAIDADFSCRQDEIICKDHLDYAYNTMAMALAFAVLYRSAFILCRMILASGNLNRYTLLEREALYGKRNEYEKKFKDTITWLTTEMIKPESINAVSDCLQCGDPHGFTLSTIFS